MYLPDADGGDNPPGKGSNSPSETRNPESNEDQQDIASRYRLDINADLANALSRFLPILIILPAGQRFYNNQAHGVPQMGPGAHFFTNLWVITVNGEVYNLTNLTPDQIEELTKRLGNVDAGDMDALESALNEMGLPHHPEPAPAPPQQHFDSVDKDSENKEEGKGF